VQARFSGTITKFAPWFWLAGAIAPTAYMAIEGLFQGPEPCRSPYPAWLSVLGNVSVLGCILLAMFASLARPGLVTLRVLRAVLVPVVALLLLLFWVWFSSGVLGQPVCFQD
jgi:hypothetical protein